jgi:S-DNA-T family DNA segregation ATPase FtsK/SpoIIIE
MVLGTSAHKNGIKATIFTRRDLGIGYLAGEDDDPQITRTFYVDGPAAEAIAARARAAREAAGTLSGYCLGDDIEESLTPAAALLDDLRVVFASAEVTWMWSEDLVARLAELRPDVYTRWDPELLARSLRALGIETKQLNRTGPDGRRLNRRGIEVEQLAVAAIPATRSSTP